MLKVIPIRNFGVQNYLILSENEVILIDGGFLGGVRRIQKALLAHGKNWRDVTKIIISHGHLDHTLNIATLQELTQAEVYAPRLDEDRILCRYRHQGPSRLCGALEKIGAFLFRHRLPTVGHWFQNGDTLGGLEVIALPGHTEGHCGFFYRDEQLLIANDLACRHFFKTRESPIIFCQNPTLARESLLKVAKMTLRGIYLNHSKADTPQNNLASLIDLADHLQKRL